MMTAHCRSSSFDHHILGTAKPGGTVVLFDLFRSSRVSRETRAASDTARKLYPAVRSRSTVADTARTLNEHSQYLASSPQ